MGQIRDDVRARSSAGSMLEHSVIVYLVDRFDEIGSEGVNDIVSLIGELRDPGTTPEDRIEIVKTIREILFPEVLGDIRFEPIDPTEEMPKNLKARADHIGKRIREIRKSRKLNQTELARESGLPQPHISRLERGEHSPSFKTLTKIAKALEIEVGDLDPAH